MCAGGFGDAGGGRQGVRRGHELAVPEMLLRGVLGVLVVGLEVAVQALLGHVEVRRGVGDVDAEGMEKGCRARL